MYALFYVVSEFFAPWAGVAAHLLLEFSGEAEGDCGGHYVLHSV